MPRRHLYRHGAKTRMESQFVRRYGRRGRYIYGAVVGKVKRQRQKKYGHRRRSS